MRGQEGGLSFPYVHPGERTEESASRAWAEAEAELGKWTSREVIQDSRRDFRLRFTTPLRMRGDGAEARLLFVLFLPWPGKFT
jgi:hypothetical protein